MISVSAQAPDLVRALQNALHFMPAGNSIEHVFVSVDAVSVHFGGCKDGYVAGFDTSEAYGGPAEWHAMLLATGDAKVLLASLKETKKYAVTLVHDQGLLTLDAEGRPKVAWPTANLSALERGTRPHQDFRTYQRAVAILGEVEKRQNAIPGVLALDPALLTPFAKVKTGDTRHKMDLLMTDEYAPVGVKIGHTFRGFVIPIHRETHAKNVGEEGLW